MAKIKVMDFLKDVELNRRKLINSLQDAGKNVDKGASLTTAVSLLDDKMIKRDGQCEIEFFDADGTRLADNQYVDVGGSVTPPATPNLYPELLEFDGWIGANKDGFNNIWHDVQFGASYRVKDRNYHLLFLFTESTGLELGINLYQTGPLTEDKNQTIRVDWGDGTFDEYIPKSSAVASHTYTDYGYYEMTISSTKQMESFTNGTYVSQVQYAFFPKGLTIASTRDALLRYIGPLVHSRMLNAKHMNLTTTIFEMYYGDNENGGPQTNSALVFPRAFNGNGVFMMPKDVLIFNYDNGFKEQFGIYGNTCRKIIIPSFATSGVTIGANIDVLHQTYPNTKFIIESCEKIQVLSSNTIYGNVEIDILGRCGEISLYGGSQGLRSLQYTSDVGKITYLGGESGIKKAIIPDKTVVSNGCLYACRALTDITFPQGFSQSLNFSYCYRLSLDTILHLLNRFTEGTTPTTFTFNSTYHKPILNAKLVKVVDNEYVECRADEENAISLMDAFINKGATISFITA